VTRDEMLHLADQIVANLIDRADSSGEDDAQLAQALMQIGACAMQAGAFFAGEAGLNIELTTEIALNQASEWHQRDMQAIDMLDRQQSN